MSHTFGTQTNVSYLLQQLWVLMLRLVQSKPSSILKLNASILFLAPSYIVTSFSIFSFCFVLCVSVCVCVYMYTYINELYIFIQYYICIYMYNSLILLLSFSVMNSLNLIHNESDGNNLCCHHIFVLHNINAHLMYLWKLFLSS